MHQCTRSELSQSYWRNMSGYTPQRDTSYISQCQEDGTWSSTANFLCSPVDCGMPPSVANSTSVSYTATTFGENVTVICLPGFSPLDGITFTCDETRNWAGETRSCTLVDCEEPPSVDGAVAHFEHTKLNATVFQHHKKPTDQ
ncbi:CUB and sushi domain-containing protein 1 [Elysia marginata]|uniref:CUB and sushi domain-containing protein 1 n=1 Tax=Elysia marginata TaxID=1093978 RepID=A0AAV4FJ93_9GAST|nr:CUB and sushi domain-containing protein 1 [Elysia marginata]